MIRHLAITLVSSVSLVSSAFAWWDEGHMQIAAVAYSQLTPSVRAKADALIKLNPDYPKWVEEYPVAKRAQYAFVRAATWADDIKKPDSGYTDDKPTDPTAGQNLGYYDTLKHAYWHYSDIPFSPDKKPLEPGDPVNAGTQIKALSAGLRPSSGLPDDVRSYDLVWLLHLVGDVHQPLHATSRFTAALPHGDQGGNKETVKPATGETIALHAYWDRLLGSYSTPEGAIYDAFTDKASKLLPADATADVDQNPDHWLAESEKLAETVVYNGPVASGPQPYVLDRAYETAARDTARSQAALAGARLANLINDALK